MKRVAGPVQIANLAHVVDLRGNHQSFMLRRTRPGPGCGQGHAARQGAYEFPESARVRGEHPFVHGQIQDRPLPANQCLAHGFQIGEDP